MAAVGGSVLTFVDMAKLKDPNGSISSVAQNLSQVNDWSARAHWQESNKDTCEQFTIQTSLPDCYWVVIGKGIPLSKATTAQIQEGWGILETRNEIPRHLAMREPNLALFRMTQDKPAQESLRQKGGTAFFYGNGSVSEEQFTGLAPRMGTLSGGNSANVISLGGATANQQTSIYLCGWGPDSMYMFWPKGSMMGIEHLDLGLITDQNAGGTGLRMESWSSVFSWGLGLALKDWRFAVRICNIDVPALIALSGNQAVTATTNILHGMIRALARIPHTNCRRVFHANRTVFAALWRIGLEKSNALLRIDEAASQFGQVGEPRMTFCGVEIVLCDAILNTEAVVA